jgi:hypothetical protein
MTSYRMLARIGVGVCLTVAIALWWGGRSNAMIIDGGTTAHFGMFGVARGQTARINVVNICSPRTDETNRLPPGPCRVQAGFIDANGMRLAERAMIIDGCKSASVDLANASDTADRRTPGGRVEIRAFVTTDPPDPILPAPACAATVEVFDANTGQTSFGVPGETRYFKEVDPAPATPGVTGGR